MGFFVCIFKYHRILMLATIGFVEIMFEINNAI